MNLANIREKINKETKLVFDHQISYKNKRDSED